jgi:putative NADPH-quinone reductase/1,4-dihydroxy-2-naphthoate octaprenyltransferase
MPEPTRVVSRIKPAGDHRRPASLKVLIILGHPRKDSLCGALADAYAVGAEEAGVNIRRLNVADMTFNPDVIAGSPRNQVIEPSIVEAMDLLEWADHIVFVFPTWWGTMPAVLKGLLDRVLIPGFAFEEHEDGPGWTKLLTGRSAHLLTTMDTPPWVYRWIYRSPGLNGLARATLGFCGIAPVRRSIFGPVKESDPQRRSCWLDAARRHGTRLRDGVLTRGERVRDAIGSWVAALRLQFHPMAWAAYGIGAAGAYRVTGKLDVTALWLGWFCLFCLEIATVFTNDYFDFESDRRNRNFGPFTGGARTLVDGRITHNQMRLGIAAAIGCFLIVAVALAFVVRAIGPILLLTALAILAIGYTTPPLKLCWRGLGELDVAFTHSTAIILCGYMFQGGSWDAPFPWLVSLPLFLSVLLAIILSGIPDYAADRAVGKRTLAVALGPRPAIRLAQAATVLAALVALLWEYKGVAAPAFAAIGIPVLPYAIVQTLLLERFLRSGRAPGRIDGLMAVSLFYIVWFVALPLWQLTHQAG